MMRAADSSQLIPVECHDLRRLGAAHAGGYVVPMGAVQRSKHLISLGLPLDWTFEKHFLQHNPAVCIHCYDHSITGRAIAVDSAKNFLRMLVGPSKKRWQRAVKYFSYWSFFRGRIHHHQNRVWYNHESDSVTMRDVFSEAGHGEVFLKLDIDGSEYRLLSDILEFQDRIDAMVIEFHDIDIMADQFDDAIAQIRQNFYVVHVHGNNSGGVSPSGFPNILEVTFQNKRLFDGEPVSSRRSYPIHGLDARNDPDRPELLLHFAL